MKRRVVSALAIGMLAALVVPNIPVAVADDAAAVTHLNPWSIDGALFARGSDGVAGVDIPGACLGAYQAWEDLRRAEHDAAVGQLRDLYRARVAENTEAIANGAEPPNDDVPPLTAITEDQYVARFMAMPADFVEYLEQEWEPMEVVPGTSISCIGQGVLPSPPGGFIGINLGDEPLDPDPCVGQGHLPFSPAVWTFYPYWHDKAPTTAAGTPYSGIKSTYSGDDATLIFTFIPIVIGVQLSIECLAIFPYEEASTHFEEQLPAAELTVVPEAIGVTGAPTKLWYDFSDPGKAVVGPITVGFDHRGTTWRLTAYAWVDAVGWDLDFSADGSPVWDESIDFPDTGWRPANSGEYAALGGSLQQPARVYVYEAKDFYTIATGVTWRGYYVVEEIAGIGWGFTEQYAPVTRWTILPYQVDEIVGRRN